MSDDADPIWEAFKLAHPEFADADPNWLGSEVYNRWIQFLKRAAAIKPAIEAALEPQDELPVTRRIRSGAKEPTELDTFTDELRAWMRGREPQELARIRSEFQDAYEVPPEVMTELTKRLRTGVQE